MSDPLMSRAIQLAIENVRTSRGGPFAALVVQGGTIIGEGTNLVTTTNDPTAHAEIVAIRDACRRLGGFQLSGCDVYTTCEPCPMCLGAIYWARVSRIFFASTQVDAAAAGFDDALIYSELGLESGQRRIPMIALMRTEALDVFEEWRRKQDRVPY